jgi:hypothetical protein
MNQKSVEKLTKAGYVFIRARKREHRDGESYAIEQSREHGEWITLDTFKTKEECLTALGELEKDPFIVMPELKIMQL